MPNRRSVTFINPFAEGHHVYYGALLANGLIEKGYRVYVVGGHGFVDGMKGLCSISGAAAIASSRPATITETEKIKFLGKALKAAGKFYADYIHLQQLDRFILTLALLKPFSDLSRVFGTLHWAALLDEFAPNNLKRRKVAFERMVLRHLAGNGLKVMAHSKKFVSILNGITRSDAAGYVPYPVNFPAYSATEREAKKKSLRSRLSIAPDATVLLSFGGTRYDKGADIAVSALKHLPGNIELLIAGSAEHFSKDALISIAEKAGVRKRLKLCMEYIPEEAVVDYFAASDIVVAPYRKIFAGQCGPITIAASMGIPVVGSDSMIIKETVEGYSLGKTFPSENVVSFANAVMEVGGAGPSLFASKTEEFSVDHCKESFCGAVIRNYERVPRR